jgi:hypothetical protein
MNKSNLDWSIVDLHSGYIFYNNVIRQANPDLKTYIAKSELSSWGNGHWVEMFQLAVL